MAIKLGVVNSFPKTSFAGYAANAWAEFSKYWVDEIDVAHWLIEPDSGTIKLSARSSTKDTVGGKWEDLEPIIVLVEGIIDALNASKKNELSVVRAEFREWAEKGIIQSLGKRQFQSFVGTLEETKAPLAVVTSYSDAGLLNDDLKVLWSTHGSDLLAKLRGGKKKSTSRNTKKSTKKP